jgi:hypothetical protein
MKLHLGCRLKSATTGNVVSGGYPEAEKGKESNHWFRKC